MGCICCQLKERLCAPQGKNVGPAWRAVLSAAPRTVLLCSRDKSSANSNTAVLGHLAAVLSRILNGVQDAEQARQEIVSLCAACLADAQAATCHANADLAAAMDTVTQSAFALLEKLAQADPNPRKLWAATWSKLMPAALLAGFRSAGAGGCEPPAVVSMRDAMSAVLTRPGHGAGIADHFGLPSDPALVATDGAEAEGAQLEASVHAADLMSPIAAAFPDELQRHRVPHAPATGKASKRKRSSAQAPLTAADVQQLRDSLPRYAAWLVGEAVQACKQRAAEATAGDAGTESTAQQGRDSTAPMGVLWALLRPVLLVMRSAAEQLASQSSKCDDQSVVKQTKRHRAADQGAHDAAVPQDEADTATHRAAQAWCGAASICRALLAAASEHQVRPSPLKCAACGK